MADQDAAAAAIYGQKSQPNETPDFLAASQSSLAEEIDKLPHDKKAGWIRAVKRCPDLVGDDHRLMFLRCEVFDAKLAAARICKYWNRRIELFGENRAFRPLHIGRDGALSSDEGSEHDDPDEVMVRLTIKGLRMGFIRPTETHDDGGRALIFGDPSKLVSYDKNNPGEREGVARAVWYALHSILEGNDIVQRVGMVAIAWPQHAKLHFVDRKLMKMNLDSMTGCIPIRLGGFHVCQPPWFFGKVVFPIMKMFMSERMRKRVRIHSGSEEKVLEDLKAFGLGKEVLPTEIGGDVILDTDKWMNDVKSRGL